VAKKQISESLASAMAKPTEVEIRGEKFQVTPISIDDLAEFESRIKSRRLSEAMKAAQEAELPAEEKLQILKEIQRQPITGEILTGRNDYHVRYSIYSVENASAISSSN